MGLQQCLMILILLGQLARIMVTPIGGSTTRIGVKKIVIEVNRDLTVEQLEILDNALKQVGLVKTTKVMFHTRALHTVHKPRPAKPTTHHVFRIGHDSNPNLTANR